MSVPFLKKNISKILTKETGALTVPKPARVILINYEKT